MPKASRKKKQQQPKQQVPLEPRNVLGGHCTMLTPSPITNSGKADGGWMDRVGISAVGLDHIFETGTPVECFYSNDAYAKAGFCTLHLELHPPQETPLGLVEYLESYLKDTENDEYRRGNYRKLEHDVAQLIENPSTIGSTATTIVQRAFEVPITPGPNIPKGLTATTYSALIHFEEKGNVLFKANNFQRHSPPLDYQTILSSISYKPDAAPYHGPDPTLSGMSAFFVESRKAMARADCLEGNKPKYCLSCGASSQPNNGGELMTCGRCKTATYCQRSCATSDWKRHKKSLECRPRSTA